MVAKGPGASPGLPDEGAGDLDLNQLGSALKRARGWIIVPTVVVLVGATVAVNMVTPRYTAETKLLLQSAETTFTRPVSATAEQAGPVLDERDLGSQALVASSRDVARKVIESLGLRGNPEFDRYAAPGVVRSTLMAVGLMRAPTEAQREEALIEEYRERVLAFTTGVSRVMTIEFTSVDPALAARGANTVAALFLEAQAESKKQAARTAGNWLLNTIEPLREKVALAEARVEDFRARKGLLAAGPNATLPQQQLAEMNTQLSTARSAQADAEARAKLIRDALAAGRPLEISDVANNELVRKLSVDRATLRAQIALESRSLLPGHPRMKELAAQLADIDLAIRASAEKAVRTLENDSRVQGARVEQLTAALDELKTRSARANEDEVELRALEREAKTQREQLEAMMARYRDAVSRDAKDAVPADARVISTATPPATPSFPKRLPIVIVSTVTTLLVAIAIVVTRELLSGRAYIAARPATPAPMAPSLPVPGAGSVRIPEESAPETETAATEPPTPVPPVPEAVTTAVGEVPERSASEPPPLTLEDLAGAVAAVLDDATGPEGPLLLFVSTDETLARDSAYAIVRDLSATRRAVLVEGPSTSRVTGREPMTGLGDIVSGDAAFVDILHRDPASRAHIVPSGAPLAGDRADWAAPLGRAVAALRQTYGVVLVCAPSPAVSHASQVLAEAATLVVWLVHDDAGSDAEDAMMAALPPGVPAPITVRVPEAEVRRATA